VSPVDYVAKLDQMYQKQGFPPYRWSKFDTSPWTPFVKPLHKARIALVSSAGVFRDDQEPFNPWAVNDLSFREIPRDTPYSRLKLHHNYFDHRDAIKDLNCVFPVQRLIDLEREGFVASAALTHITLSMGRLYKRSALAENTVPSILEVLGGQDTDAVLLVAA